MTTKSKRGRTHVAGALALAFGAWLGGAEPSAAQTLASLPSPAPVAAVTGDAKPIAAWVEFCQRFPVECTVNSAEPTTIALTPKIWQSIVAVNRQVNGRLKAATDMDHLGIPDQWDFPDDGYADCEDYQLLKRRELAEIGLPRRAMRMTVVIDEEGQGHAVLLVRTDRGDFVLDNKRNAVLPWHQTGYVYIKREGQASMAWVSLGGVTSPTATANR